MSDASPLEKARAVKRKNDAARSKKLDKVVGKIDAYLEENEVTVTEACRKYNTATDAYYRHKKRLNILTDASS